ncbi:hypothetical protein [Catellatospora tritici]|uniref:hypothetical protein n=1 Tax=Catellatospora tritici TaxID=2851566 RepID=UPI001C2DB350|nr:hypothetical protein [Catellatospora tritici]MBV1849975.1 hypothetical protein [Catellatospora tritici]
MRRQKRRRRYGDRILLGLLVLSFATAAAVVIWGRSPSVDVSAATTASPSRGPDKPPACQVKENRCGTVSVPEVGLVSYAVLPGTANRGLVLVEAGGPGGNALAHGDRPSLGLPDSLKASDILLVNEPWVGTTLDDACEAALEGFVRHIVGGSAEPRPLCAVRTWTAQTYTAALHAILEQEHATLTGIVGQSFGALPAAAAGGAYPAAWLLLNAPIAPADVTGAEVTRARVQNLNEAIDRSYTASCQAIGLDCARRGVDVLHELIDRAPDVAVAGRSQPITRGDLAAAAFGAAYGLAENSRWLWTTFSRWPDVGTEVQQQVGRMADQVLTRYERGRVSPAMAGFVAGMCSSYAGWTDGPQVDATQPQALLVATQRQCAAQASAAPAWPAVRVQRTAMTCVASNDRDPVVSRAWAQAWQRLMPGAHLATYTHDSHASTAIAAGLIRDSACVNLLTR